MKISKIFAGMSALAIAATMAVTASAVTPKTADSINPCVKPWSGDTGAMKDWTSGDLWNGGWTQFYTTTNDFSGLTVTFTVDTTSAEWEQAKQDDGSMMSMYETGTYTVLRAFNTAAANSEPGKYEGGMAEGSATGDFAVSDDGGVLTLTITGEQFQAAVDAGDVNPAECKDDDGNVYAYNVGFNIQCGHYKNASVTCEITGSNLIETEVDADGNIVPVLSEDPSSTTDSSKTDTSSTGDTSSKTDSSSAADSKSSSSSKAGTTSTGSTKTTSTAATSSTASDNTNAGTGATAGIALAGIALAGAALVVAKRK